MKLPALSQDRHQLITVPISKVIGAVDGLAGRAGPSRNALAFGSAMFVSQLPESCRSVLAVVSSCQASTWCTRQIEPALDAFAALDGRTK